MNNKRYFVYTLIDPRNGQPFYVGAGSGNYTARRLSNHISEAKNDQSKWTNVPKCELIVELLELGLKPLLHIQECVDATHSGLVEKETIAKFGRRSEGGLLTNVHIGGGGIRRRAKGQSNNKITLPPRPVYQFDLDGNLLKCHAAVCQAAESISVTHTAIVNACRGKSDVKTVGGYRWSYKDNQLPPLVKSNRAKRTIYEQYDLDDNLIATYQTGLEMKKSTGVDPSSVHKFINGKIRHAGGFRWKVRKE